MIDTYILHLHRDVKRKEHIETHIKTKLNNAKIYTAIDGSNKKLTNSILKKHNLKVAGTFIHPNGAIGIWCSYILFFQYMIKNNIEEALIIQDDIQIEDNFLEKLNKIRNVFSKNYNIIRLGSGDTGLLVSIKGAKKFLRKILSKKVIDYPTDVWMVKNNLINKPKIQIENLKMEENCYLLIPNDFRYRSSRIDASKNKKSKNKKLIFGLGTGRCGTVSLSVILNTGNDTLITHEGISRSNPPKRRVCDMLPWKINKNLLQENIDKILNQTESIVGDVAFYYLPYVKSIIKKYPNAKFICLKREKEATVNSYMAKTNKRNHWQRITSNSKWKLDRNWDPCFPKYNVKNKRKAIGMYWDEYYSEAEKLQKLYPDKFVIIHTNQLNSEKKLKELKDFIEMPSMDTIPKKPFNKGNY